MIEATIKMMKFANMGGNGHAETRYKCMCECTKRSWCCDLGFIILKTIVVPLVDSWQQCGDGTPIKCIVSKTDFSSEITDAFVAEVEKLLRSHKSTNVVKIRPVGPAV